MDDDWDSLSAPAPAPVQAEADNGGVLIEDDDDFGGGSAPAPQAQAQFQDDDMFGAPAPQQPQQESSGFDGFGEDSAPAPVADTGFGGGGLMDDDFGAPAPVQTEAPAQDKKVSMFTTAPMVDQCDTSILDKWEENHRQQLKEKRAKSEQKRVEALKEGEKAADKFFKERTIQIETNKKNNRAAEEQFCQDRDAALKAGLNGKESWEKVCSYVDLASDPKRKSNVSRLKSIYIAVKSTPPSTVKNFSA